MYRDRIISRNQLWLGQNLVVISRMTISRQSIDADMFNFTKLFYQTTSNFIRRIITKV